MTHHWMLHVYQLGPHADIGLALWRYLWLGLLLWQWPRVCRWWGRRRGLSDQAIVGLIQRRWWFLGFVVLFEAVVVYGV